jgi:hypothetical protein
MLLLNILNNELDSGWNIYQTKIQIIIEMQSGSLSTLNCFNKIKTMLYLYINLNLKNS